MKHNSALLTPAFLLTESNCFKREAESSRPLAPRNKLSRYGWLSFLCIQSPRPTPAAALLVFSTFFTRASVCMLAMVGVVGPAQHLDKWSKLQRALARI